MGHKPMVKNNPLERGGCFLCLHLLKFGSMKLNSKSVSILVIILLAILAGYFIYRDYSKTKDSQSVLTSGAQSTEQTDTGGVVYETGESSSNLSESVKKIPQPDISGAYIVPARYPEFYRTAMETKIDLALGAIEKDKFDFAEWGNLAIYLKNIDYVGKTAEIWEYLSKVSPGNPIYLSNLGDLYHLYLKDFPKSEARWLEAIKSDATKPQYYLGLFDLYRYSYKTNTTAAVDIIKQGLAKIPDEINLLTNLAGYYKEKGDMLNAKYYYQNALVQAQKNQNQPLIDAITRDLNSL